MQISLFFTMTLEHVRIILEQLGYRLGTEETRALYNIGNDYFTKFFKGMLRESSMVK